VHRSLRFGHARGLDAQFGDSGSERAVAPPQAAGSPIFADCP
jgi:hypothetical protein